MDDKATILIVDDEPVNIQLLASSLKAHYHLKIATTGEQCIQLSESEPPPDLILLDIEMPKMNGYEVCKQLKKNEMTASIPIIFITAMNQDDDEEKGLRLGAVDYLTKPFRSAILLARVANHIKLKKQHDTLLFLAMRDQLTKLFNRHYMLETANQRVARAKRKNTDISLLMMDIDHFKLINDTYGHAEGDVVLKTFAELLMQESRHEDIVARFGGEEFVFFLDECDINTAKKIAERIRSKTERLNPNNIKVTVSIGISQLRISEENFSGLVKRADDAMYKAKEKGRNRIIIDKNDCDLLRQD